MQGQARITATGMEALLASAAKDPDLAPLLGGLTLAVQLAKREQGRMVWNVAMKDGTITVNGVDPTHPQLRLTMQPLDVSRTRAGKAEHDGPGPAPA